MAAADAGDAQAPRLRALGAERLLHQARPDAPRRAILGDLLEEVDVGVEEERQPRRERVDLHAAIEARLDVGDAVRQRVGRLLGGRGAGVAEVRGDRDRVEARQLLGAVLDRVDHQAHRRRDGKDPRAARAELLEQIVLNRAGDALLGHALFGGDRLVHGEEDRGRAVDGERRGDLVERDAVEDGLHIGERIDGHADLADLAERVGRVGVEAELRRQIERHRQARLSRFEEILEALVGLLRRAEAGVLPHRPHLAEIHRRDRCRA